MENLTILKSKEKKEIQKLLDMQFDPDFKLDYEVFINNKNRIFILNRELSRIDIDELRVNSLGLYFGELNNNALRLSIDASQMVGKTAKKNILILNDEDILKWMNGEDLELETELDGFVLVKHKDDFLGCGKIVNKKLYNYVPKERRL